MRAFSLPAVETALFDNCKRNKKIILWLSVVWLAAFVVSLFFAGRVAAFRDAEILHFYLVIFDAGRAAGLFFRELLSLALFLLLLALLSLHVSLVPVVYLFFAFRGFAMAVLVWQLFAIGVFAGIAGLFFILPFVLLNYFLLLLYGAYAVSCAFYFRRCRAVDWKLLLTGLLVYLALIAVALLLELLLFLVVLKPFFGLAA